MSLDFTLSAHCMTLRLVAKQLLSRLLQDRLILEVVGSTRFVLAVLDSFTKGSSGERRDELWGYFVDLGLQKESSNRRAGNASLCAYDHEVYACGHSF